MAELDLSVIILSFNTKEITLRCLDKLKVAKDYCEKRLKNQVGVVVLDNGSEDGSVGEIREFREKNPWIKLIESKENLGFSKGNNLAMKQIKSPFILLLNSDVYVSEESLYKALAYFRVNLNCDVLGLRLNYASGKLQPSAGYLPTPLSSVFWILGVSNFPFIDQFTNPFHPTYRSFFTKAHQVGWVSGAFFMFKQEVFEKVGGFDENIFMYMDEVEWCKRISDKDFRIWYVPLIEVVHLHGASSKFDLKRQYTGELKGIRYFLKKHYSSQYFLVKPILILGLILRVTVFSLIGKTERAKAYMEGLSII